MWDNLKYDRSSKHAGSKIQLTGGNGRSREAYARSGR